MKLIQMFWFVFVVSIACCYMYFQMDNWGAVHGWFLSGGLSFYLINQESQKKAKE